MLRFKMLNICQLKFKIDDYETSNENLISTTMCGKKIMNESTERSSASTVEDAVRFLG